MRLDLETALRLTRWILSLGIILQGIEILATRQIYAASGILGWPSRARISPRVMAKSERLLTFFSSEHGVGLVVVSRLLIPIGLLIPFGAGVSSYVTPSLLLLWMFTSGFLVVRTRGPLCGGSDSMFFQVQVGLFVSSLGFLNPSLPKLGLAWIAAQSVLSYFLSGVSKLRNADWRSGRALRNLFTSEGPYVLHDGIKSLSRFPIVCTALTWGLIAFELLFPSILFLPEGGKLMFLFLGLTFHVLNAALLGLNRFIWAWAATYPALLCLR